MALLALGTTKADPETVDGLLKKNTNTWQVPIVAKQPNENKPTQVIGGYPQLEPDTLARPLKAKQGKYKCLVFCNANLMRKLFFRSLQVCEGPLVNISSRLLVRRQVPMLAFQNTFCSGWQLEDKPQQQRQQQLRRQQ